MEIFSLYFHYIINSGAPVATPEESVTPPATDECIKPIAEIKQVAEETVKEAIVAASKSVDEKINAIVAKPEVNEQDSQNQNTSTTHVDTSVELIQDSSENANANENENEIENDSNSEQVPNNIEINNETQTKTNDIIVPETTTTTNSLGLVDCTKIDPINNLPSSEPPALPDCPPPSQLTVFAETAMSVVDVNQIEPKSIPIIEIETNAQSDDESALVGEQKIEINIIESQQIANVIATDIEKLATDIDNVKLSNESTAVVIVDVTKSNDESIANEIADAIMYETINETDDSKQNANIDNVNDDIQMNGDEPSKDDVESVEISSPLPYSLESLPSPQSSNVTSPNEIDDIATNEQNDISLPPPPADLIDTETTESELPPPIECVDDFNESDDAKNDEGTTTNGGAEIMNGSHTNGAIDAATDHSEKVITTIYATNALRTH